MRKKQNDELLAFLYKHVTDLFCSHKKNNSIQIPSLNSRMFLIKIRFPDKQLDLRREIQKIPFCLTQRRGTRRKITRHAPPVIFRQNGRTP